MDDKTDDRIVSPKPQAAEDVVLDRALRPQRLDDLIGQDRVRENLSIVIEAAKKRGLKFLTSFHHGYNWKYYEPAFQYDAKDPRLAGLYGRTSLS